MILRLAFYYFSHHLNIQFFNWLMFRYCDWHTAKFTESIVTAATFGLFHLISVFFKDAT